MPRILTLAAILLPLFGCQSPEERLAVHLKNARDYMAQEQTSLARVELKNVLQIDPNQAEAYYLRAQLLERDQEWRAMYANLQRTIELVPDHLDAHQDLAKLYLMSGELPQAKVAIDKVLAVAPEAQASLTLAGGYHLRHGDLEAADAFAQQALAADGTQLEALALEIGVALLDRDFRRADAAVQQALTTHPEKPTARLFQIRAAEARGDAGAVIAGYQALIALEPEELAYRRMLAMHHLQNDSPEPAEDVLRNAVDALPDNTDAKLLLAQYLASRSPADAIEALESFIAQAPDSGLRFQLAGLYRQTGDLESAGRVYQAIVADPQADDAALSARTELATLALQSQDAEEAQALINEVLAADPAHPEAQMLQAYLELENGHTEATIASLRSVLRDQPTNDKALTLLGEAYLRQRSAELAESSFAQAVESNHYNAIAAKRLATAYLRRGQFQQVEDVLRPVVNTDRGDAETVLMFVQARLAERNWTGATGIAARIFGEDSDMASYIEAIALQGQERHAEAFQKFEALLASNPNSAAALAGATAAAVAADRASVASDYLHAHWNKHPDSTMAASLLADQFMRQRQPEDARQVVEQQLSRQPGWLDGYAKLGSIHLSRDDPQAAMAAYRSGLEQQPEAHGLALRLANLAERSGDPAAAEKLYRRVLTAQPGIDAAANNLAMLLSVREETRAEALEIAQQLQYSAEPMFKDTLGWLYVLNGEPARGRSLLEVAHNAAPDNAEIKFHLAMALYGEERYQEAAPLLASSVEMARQQGGAPFDVADAERTLATLEN